jgi:peptidoglycan/xylan/chitin deacetylase (PgdA/CDA1 family)
MTTFKPLLKHGLLASGIPHLASLCRRGRCAVLSYHSVQPMTALVRNALGEGITHDPAVFEQHVKYVSRYCSIVTLEDVADAIETGHRLPRRSVAFTFDDGMKDNYEIVAPLLEKHGCRGMFYVTAGCVHKRYSPFFVRLRYALFTTKSRTWSDPLTGLTWSLGDNTERYGAFIATVRHCTIMRNDVQLRFITDVEKQLDASYDALYGCCCMTFDQVRDLLSRGHMVGGHTVSHVNLAQVPFGAACAEITEARQIVSANTGYVCQHMAYPNPIYTPNWNERIAEFLAASGFRTAVTSEEGIVRPGDPAFALRRIHPGQEGDELKWRLEAALGLDRIG